MATYSTPTGAEMRNWTRIPPDPFGFTNTQLETELATRVQDGEDDTFGTIGDTFETDATLTNRQVRLLKRAVSFRTAVILLRGTLADKTEGAQEPLVMEEAESIRLLIADYVAEAERLEGRVQDVQEEDAVALPSVSTSTFDVDLDDRTPSERADLIDQQDDVSAWDIDNG